MAKTKLEELVEFVSVPGSSGIEIQQITRLLVSIAGGTKNLPANIEAFLTDHLPMFVENVNGKLHPQGLHLLVREDHTLDLQHRADGTSAGTNEEKAACAVEVIHAELEKLLTELNNRSIE